MSEKSVLNPDQQRAYERLVSSERNIFLTGAPGTGKSFLIRHFLREHKESPPVLASTGAAAILVGGRSFHSFFGLGIMQGGAEQTFLRAKSNKTLRRRLLKAQVLVMDEVSMLSHDVFDCAEKLCRALRGSDEPWGGIRVIAVGDFAQLPPVSRSTNKEWAFLGEAWAFSAFECIALRMVMRTSEREFLEVLEDLRWGRLSERARRFLDDRVREEEGVEETTPRIVARRNQAEAFNRMRLESLPGKITSYQTRYSGQQRYVEMLAKNAPIPGALELKEGALVMLRMNDPKQRFVNGTVARVVLLREKSVIVDIGGREIELQPFCFTYMDADGNEVAAAENFPLSLAYASTIHKSQGASLDRAHVDLMNLWEPGQAYVALSRVRSSQGLTLSGWSPSSFRSDPLVEQFYSSF